MPKLLQINPVVRRNTSTGKIMLEIGELAAAKGWESYVAFSRGRDGDGKAALGGCSSVPVPVGSRLSVALHGLETRLFDRHGLGSRLATLRFIREIRRIDPDVIHIHNVHGYFLNYPLFFRYLAGCGKPVIWTVHDCWLYTGHCYYYSVAACDRWKARNGGCRNCPQRGSFPKSWLIDRSSGNYRDKAAAFTSIPSERMLFVPVSYWMREEMAQSFLAGCRFRVIHNGIDTEVFSPRDTQAVRSKYGLGDRRVILGVASIWTREKGFGELRAIARNTWDDEVVVMVGRMTPEQRALLPENVVVIGRTENQTELAQLYSAATVFVNPTWQDNYPTVNLESISCGTPVVTYRTGGSVESIVEDETGFVIEQGDVAGLVAAIRFIERTGKERYSAACRSYALAHFRKQDRYAEYLELYSSLLSGESAL